eukprot:3610484-Pyramimonas_sp.AAC.1
MRARSHRTCDRDNTGRVPLLAAVFNSRVPILAASEPTTLSAYACHYMSAYAHLRMPLYVRLRTLTHATICPLTHTYACNYMSAYAHLRVPLYVRLGHHSKKKRKSPWICLV